MIDLYGVKPVDADALRRAVAVTGSRILTVEDHYAEGGSAASTLLKRHGIGRYAIVQGVRQILAASRPVAA